MTGIERAEEIVGGMTAVNGGEAKSAGQHHNQTCKLDLTEQSGALLDGLRHSDRLAKLTDRDGFEICFLGCRVFDYEGRRG
jgi:hypothetical protein